MGESNTIFHESGAVAIDSEKQDFTEIEQLLDKERIALNLTLKDNYSTFWSENLQKEESRVPNMVKGDFNGDNADDMAAILKDSVQELYLCVFQTTRDKEYDFYILEHIGKEYDTDGKINASIEFREKGIVEGVYDTTELKNRGIELVKFEKSAKVFFWNDTVYSQIYLSD